MLASLLHIGRVVAAKVQPTGLPFQRSKKKYASPPYCFPWPVPIPRDVEALLDWPFHLRNGFTHRTLAISVFCRWRLKTISNILEIYFRRWRQMYFVRITRRLAIIVAGDKDR